MVRKRERKAMMLTLSVFFEIIKPVLMLDVPPTVMDALQRYEVRAIPWSKRNEVVEELRA